jgi:hypothetical protein
MKRTVISILTIGLVAGALFAPAADAGKRRKKPYRRTATYKYQAPAFGQPEVGGGCPGEPRELDGCATFPTRGKDKFVKVTIKDKLGLDVSGSITHPDQDGDGFVEPVADFCRKSKKVAITPGADVIVFPYMIGSTGVFESLGLPGQCLGVATQGKIKAVFTEK